MPTRAPASAACALVAAVSLLAAAAATAEGAITLACPQPRSAPTTCTMYTLPNSVVGPASANGATRVRLTKIRWRAWGRVAATASARMRFSGRSVRVRLRADGRVSDRTGGGYYTRLRVTRNGRSHTINLERFTEQS